MNKSLIIFAVAVVIFVILGVAIYGSSKLPEASERAGTVAVDQKSASGEAVGSAPQSGSAPENATPVPAAMPERTFTLAELSSYSTPDNCYAAVRGSVYDLTAWIKAHPGGERGILSLCGKDGTSAFEKQHGGQSGPEETLTGFRIGSLSS